MPKRLGQQTANNASLRNLNTSASWGYSEPPYELVSLVLSDLVSMIKTVTLCLET